MSLPTAIKRHSALIALLAVLAAAVAAPYLIPDNPDSAVFRSGVFAALLLAGCLLPARQALLRCTRRELVCGLLWGLLFACALSLGSELFVYNGLLPGLGSAMRRAAVPVLAFPLLGLLAARVMLCSPARRQERAPRIPLWGFSVAFFVCWLPLLLAYFPAAINYDFPGQVGQYVLRSWDDSQPMLHTLFAGAAFFIGDALGSRTMGLLLYSLAQMALFALALGYACSFAQKRGVPAFGVFLLAALFALHPIFSVMSISTTKDTLFAAAVLVFTLQSFEIAQDCAAFCERKALCVLYALMAACIVLLRSNGVVSLMLTLPGLIIVCRGRRRLVAALCAGCIAATCLGSFAIDLAFAPEDMAVHQSLSLPAQQLVRAYNLAPLSDSQREEIRSWYWDEAGLFLHPHLADGAKAYLDDERLAGDMGGFVSLWARTALSAPREYIEAFLLLNIGSWYPDDRSHSTVYLDASYNDKGYLQTQEYDLTDLDLHTRSYLPALRGVFEQICRRNVYQKYPIVPLLFSAGIPLWGVFFACALMLSRRARLLPAALCPIGLWGSYLFFGPCTLARYMLPLFCCAPVLIAAALCLPRRAKEVLP